MCIANSNYTELVERVLGQLPTKDNSPLNKNKAQPLPTGNTIPRTLPHQDNSPLGPLPRNKTTHQDQYLYDGELPGGELSGYELKAAIIIIRNFANYINEFQTSLSKLPSW